MNFSLISMELWRNSWTKSLFLAFEGVGLAQIWGTFYSVALTHMEANWLSPPILSISYVLLWPMFLGLCTVLNEGINYCWDRLHEDLTLLGNLFGDNAESRCFSEKQGDLYKQGRFYYFTEYRISKFLSQNVKAKLMCTTILAAW